MGRLAVAAIVTMWVIPISILVNRVVPEPYMDEIFHIPQAQEYCKGNFRSWDPMITTPPGLYCLSLAYVGSLFPTMSLFNGTLSLPNLCSTEVLRATNSVLAVICSILVYDILITLRPFIDDRKATLTAVALALYPLHWFFTFLYYTDAASLTAVLAMYLACLKRNYWLSALLGALSIFIRQTNVIWMLFIACAGVINITLVPQKQKVHKVDETFIRTTKLIEAKNNADSNLRKRRSNNAWDNVGCAIHTADASLAHAEGLLSEIRHILLVSWHMKWDLLWLFSPFAVILMAFVAFVRWNGGIVLGAKDAHAVSVHFAQIMYFGLVSVLAMAPVHFTLDQVGGFFHSFWKNRPLSFLVIFLAHVVGFLSVHFFSVAHPYLLSDNRHYPFYLWRKVINAHWSAKYLLVPLYACSWLSVFSVLGKFQRRIWILAYFLATTAVLVPAPLIEFRYYTVPFYLLALNSQITESRSWLLVGLLFAAVNMFTMHMFLFCPFKWDHEPGIQRFIW